MPAEIVATLLNPGGDPPWRVELGLTSPTGSGVDREVFVHEGTDWNAKAGPILDRMRTTAQVRGWGPEPADLIGAAEPTHQRR